MRFYALDTDLWRAWLRESMLRMPVVRSERVPPGVICLVNINQEGVTDGRECVQPAGAGARAASRVEGGTEDPNANRTAG